MKSTHQDCLDGGQANLRSQDNGCLQFFSNTMDWLLQRWPLSYVLECSYTWKSLCSLHTVQCPASNSTVCDLYLSLCADGFFSEKTLCIDYHLISTYKDCLDGGHGNISDLKIIIISNFSKTPWTGSYKGDHYLKF